MKRTSLLALMSAAIFSITLHADQGQHTHHAHGGDHAHDHAHATSETAAGPFEVRGIFLGHDESEGRVTLAHEAVPEVMMAMRMHLALPEGEAVSAFEPGDKVVFQMFSRIEGGQRWYAKEFEALPEGTELSLPAELREAVGY
ncbi:copper-binding protein [Billgrantia kenyensis]|uniref:Copper-binding protein n=1 Tax=Billgrantia kenyensis TaxID=321266 RepID=A0A7V9VZ28_9GAMM|nr:copper-binding protein [Halomonas kenyensis]MBA2778025.1 copper-binding protein [Halomonas kenyensis]MCG6661496.1 copper-binding protein [Halomonas kenyensis]